jgi:protein N-terminal amidase
MDLNPYRFKTSFYEYEFAKYHLQHNTELLLCSMSWLKGKGDTSSFDTIKYWMQRLSPLFTTQQANKAIVFAACNRIGQERSSTFAGGSCIAIISNQEINLLGYLESNVTDILLIQE